LENPAYTVWESEQPKPHPQQECDACEDNSGNVDLYCFKSGSWKHIECWALKPDDMEDEEPDVAVLCCHSCWIDMEFEKAVLGTLWVECTYCCRLYHPMCAKITGQVAGNSWRCFMCMC
jgi:hypothetical protein